ncbi:cdc42 effector protein 2-like [Conger conger]|uniref:cdc42 effector protein 2-like n=1 Tax=Conger conger TaxID=82655 RepID=UPI002A5ABD5B|nr:cdc42 effector protein 2-like [Conger conger]XP_061089383.1 cdc42 effector protein 2-like [Conger conger]XP_061089384.1 cdc42 effector protein 2-like [Conger conger]XP_061089385.1 cdc42 effector protein 2-like [Conger conger]
MSTKAPIYLKRGSRKGKKEKLRDILSSDMISPPLGDFRHTIHIGSSGGENDLFGDLSFLQGKFHLLPGQQGHSLSQRCSQYGAPFQFTRTASVCTHPPSSESSPLLKNAISLPVIGAVQAITLPASGSAPEPDPASDSTSASDSAPDSPPPQPGSPTQAPPPKPPRLHLDDKASALSRESSTQSSSTPSPLTPPPSRASLDAERCLQDPDEGLQEQPYLSHAGSLLSLHLDLGPSILDDVLQIMDKHSVGGLNGACVHGGRQEIAT